MKKEVSTKKLVKVVIICLVFAALLAGLVYLMVSDQNYGSPDKLKIGENSFGQRLWIGLQVAFLGLATVFLMLVLLIAAVNIIRLALIGVDKIGKKDKVTPALAKAIENQPTAFESEDDETVVAITAAITAYYDAHIEEYKSNLKFRVRSIKEI